MQRYWLGLNHQVMKMLYILADHDPLRPAWTQDEPAGGQSPRAAPNVSDPPTNVTLAAPGLETMCRMPHLARPVSLAIRSTYFRPLCALALPENRENENR